VDVVIDIVEDIAPDIDQVNSVACCQSQGGTQGNDIKTPIGGLLVTMRRTNNCAVYLKRNLQRMGVIRFQSREVKILNPRDWNREDFRAQIESTALIQSRFFKVT